MPKFLPWLSKAQQERLEAIIEREVTGCVRRAERAHKVKRSRESKGGRRRRPADGNMRLSRSRRRVRIDPVGAIKRRSLEQLYSGPQVLEAPLYSVFEASRYLQIPRIRCVPGSPDDRIQCGPAQAVDQSLPSNSRIRRTRGCRSVTSPKPMSWMRCDANTRSNCRRLVGPSLTSVSISGVRIPWFITRCSRTASTCSLRRRGSGM